MQCPRCSEEIADQVAVCPICHKSLPSHSRSATRTALDGEAYSDPAAPILRPVAKADPAHSALTGEPVKSAEVLPPAVRLIPSNPDLFAARPHSAALKSPRAVRPDVRWLFVVFAAAGMIASAVLWHWPYVAPIQINMTPGPVEFMPITGNDRPIPPVYLWLWGYYGLLAVAAQFFLPAPWRFGATGIRTNWVLNITTVLTLLLFLGVGVEQRADGFLQRATITTQEDGSYQYSSGKDVRSVTRDEAQQVGARLVRDQEAAIFKQWNMAALLSFLALGGYAAWWIIKRPVAPRAMPAIDPNRWLRKALGEDDLHTDAVTETVPSENTRSREPASENIPWR